MSKKFILIGQGLMLSKVIDLLIKENQAIESIFSNDEIRIKKYRKLFKIFKIKQINNVKNHKEKHNNKIWILGVENTQLINKEILFLYKDKCVNFHPGILPNYGGMYVYQWAILNNERLFGSTIHLINNKIDYGDIILEKKFKINKKDTGLSVYLKCLKYGFLSYKTVIDKIINNKKINLRKQNHKKRKIYYINDIPKSEIDFKKNSEYIHNFVRAGNFLPLNSPTFKPSLFKNIFIYKTKIIKNINFKKGNIVFEKNKPVFKAKDGKGIKIELAKFKNRKKLDYKGWKKLL